MGATIRRRRGRPLREVARRTRWVVVAGLLALWPVRAPAQDLGFATALFKDVHSITIYGQAANVGRSPQLVNPSDCLISGLCGAGTEVLIDLTAPRGTHLELGLGASYLRGLQAKDERIDLRGSVRSFPSMAAYLTGDELFGERVQPYVGLNFGLTELWNAQAYDRSGFEYSIKGQTFDWGGTLGMYFNFPRFDGLFAEASYRRRRFSSLDYTFPKRFEKEDSVPPGWPRELDMSGWQFSLGWQFDLKKDKGPPPYTGLWHLSKVDDQPLPGLVTIGPAAPPPSPEASLQRKEIITGTLSLEPERQGKSSYFLHYQTRRTFLTKDGKVVGAEAPSLEVSRGTYAEREGRLWLFPTPGTAADSLEAVRVGDQLRVRLQDTHHYLLLTKMRD